MKNLKELNGAGAFIKLIPFFMWDGENEAEIIEAFNFTKYSIVNKYKVVTPEQHDFEKREIILYVNDRIWLTMEEGDFILADEEHPHGMALDRNELARYAKSKDMEFYFKETEEDE